MSNDAKKCSCYHSLDFKSAEARLKAEPFVNDEYKVELEDYENINDLIKRSIRTKTKFKPESDPSAIYESDEEIAAQIHSEWFIDQMDQPNNEPVITEDKGKQSDAKSEGETGSEVRDPLL